MWYSRSLLCASDLPVSVDALRRVRLAEHIVHDCFDGGMLLGLEPFEHLLVLITDGAGPEVTVEGVLARALNRQMYIAD